MKVLNIKMFILAVLEAFPVPGNSKSRLIKCAKLIDTATDESDFVWIRALKIELSPPLVVS